MNAVVWEHVPVAELPRAWRDRLGLALAPAEGALVTIRIEAESRVQGTPSSPDVPLRDDVLFGMWQDRRDMADVPAWVRGLRGPRPTVDGMRKHLSE